MSTQREICYEHMKEVYRETAHSINLTCELNTRNKQKEKEKKWKIWRKQTAIVDSSRKPMEPSPSLNKLPAEVPYVLVYAATGRTVYSESWNRGWMKRNLSTPFFLTCSRTTGSTLVFHPRPFAFSGESGTSLDDEILYLFIMSKNKK